MEGVRERLNIIPQGQWLAHPYTSKCEVRIGGCVPPCRAKTVRLIRIVEQLKVR